MKKNTLNKNIIELESSAIYQKILSFDELNDDDLSILSSKKGIKYLIKNKTFNIDVINKTLRQVCFEKQIQKLQEQLVLLQNWVITNNKRVAVICEGRDAAGKGGAIRRFMEHINPRFTNLVALPKPTEDEKGSWYFQRYIEKLPKPRQMVFFDRSWYNRAVVEPVNGFCTTDEHERFMQEVVDFENMLVADGIYLIKLYFSISKDEQTKRLKMIKNNPLKQWKLSPVDEKAIELWDKYTEYKNKMFDLTATDKSPWVVVNANSKMKARISAIDYLLTRIPFEQD
ncbi:MAG: polyphosphate kinase 2 [Gammaproteobacteria bacterium]|nr:MAG: polyphosphate kinase 2 [Gammaproteobacteria bacterium]